MARVEILVLDESGYGYYVLIPSVDTPNLYVSHRRRLLNEAEKNRALAYWSKQLPKASVREISRAALPPGARIL
jgi:hypothetical protein